MFSCAHIAEDLYGWHENNKALFHLCNLILPTAPHMRKEQVKTAMLLQSQDLKLMSRA